MPLLLKKISANILDNFTQEISLVKSIKGDLGMGQYFLVYGLEAFLQDYSKIVEHEEITKPTNFGLSNTQDFVLLEISY